MNITIEHLIRNENGGVVEVHWRAVKTSGEHSVDAAEMSIFNPDSSSSNYVDFENLTESMVVSWVENSIDTTALEANLTAQLSELTSPSKFEGVPW